MDGLASLFISQFYSFLIGRAGKNLDLKLNRTTHMILEEFGNLNLPQAPSISSACLSRNIRTYFVIQSKSQLSKYKEGEGVILGDATNIIFYHNTEPNMLDFVSERVGKSIGGGPLISTAALERLPRNRCLFICDSERLFPKIIPVRY